MCNLIEYSTNCSKTSGSLWQYQKDEPITNDGSIITDLTGNDNSGCHVVLTISMNLNEVAILKIRGVDYRCIIKRISKNDALNLLQNADLSEKGGTLQDTNFLYREVSKEIIMLGNIEIEKQISPL